MHQWKNWVNNTHTHKKICKTCQKIKNIKQGWHYFYKQTSHQSNIHIVWQVWHATVCGSCHYIHHGAFSLLQIGLKTPQKRTNAFDGKSSMYKTPTAESIKWDAKKTTLPIALISWGWIRVIVWQTLPPKDPWKWLFYRLFPPVALPVQLLGCWHSQVCRW